MLSNTAVPRYYGAFRDAVLRGDIHVCKEVAMEMWRIDRLIESPGYYYDDRAVEGWIEFCENELTLSGHVDQGKPQSGKDRDLRDLPEGR